MNFATKAAAKVIKYLPLPNFFEAFLQPKNINNQQSPEQQRVNNQ
jgi:hypothetical protein